MKCPYCGEEDIEGEYIGSHGVLEYYCDICQFYWNDNMSGKEIIDNAMLHQKEAKNGRS